MRNFILEELKDINPYVDIDSETDLIHDGILDSMGILVFIAACEERFNISIPIDSVEIEDFLCLESIEKLLVKLGAKE